MSIENENITSNLTFAICQMTNFVLQQSIRADNVFEYMFANVRIYSAQRIVQKVNIRSEINRSG